MRIEDPAEPQALVICGLLSTSSKMLREIEEETSKSFGPVGLRSEIVPFEWTDYYNAEMGEGILRRWIVFSSPVNLIDAWKLKQTARQIEKKYLEDNKRVINIDPGLVRLDGLWLFSTKAAGHRTYLDEGIWIELTLRFLRDHCEDLAWTYPDHRDAQAQAFFMRARELLKRSL